MKKTMMMLTAVFAMVAIAQAEEEKTDTKDQTIRSLQATVNLQKKTIANQQKQIDALKEEIKKLKAGTQTQKTASVPAKDEKNNDKPADKKKDNDEARWVVKPIQKGDVSIGVMAAFIDKIPLKNQITKENTESENNQLGIFVTITNRSKTNKLNYRTWSADQPSNKMRATLKDNFGNNYKCVKFGISEPVLRKDNESIYPGKSTLDSLIFELPIEKAESLFLTIPLVNVGGEEDLKFEIPIGALKTFAEISRDLTSP